MDKRIILEIVSGRVEPKIYAFLTNTVPRFLKVGDTYRPVRVRIGEWKDKGFAIGDKDHGFREGTDYASWPASLEQGVFFRDYEVHRYLMRIAKMERITPAVLKALPRVGESADGKKKPYSNEFFRYVSEDSAPAISIDEATGNVRSAIEDIKRFFGKKKDHKLAYRIFDLNTSASGMRTDAKVEKTPRQNQADAIKKFVAAVGTPPCKSKLLMYAVMRFGKTFTSLCCAKEMKARLVVVLSAKADVSDEWKNEVEETKNFSDYEFLDATSLKRNDKILRQIRSKKKSFVVFLTLQTFLKKKDWLDDLFKKRIDLLIVDETHFGARAAKLGRVIEKNASPADKKVNADVDHDDDAAEGGKSGDESVTVEQVALNSTVTLHLSGTPYRILMKGEFPDDKIVAFCQYTDIIAAQKAWDADYLDKRKGGSSDDEYAEWENPYYGFPEMVRFAFSPSPQAMKLVQNARERGETCSFSEIFRPEVDATNNFTGKFVHQEEVEEFLRILNGSDEGENVGFPSLLKFLKKNKRDICRHIVMVLPYCASCDAMVSLLKSGKFPNLAEYEVLNISGHKRDSVFNDPSEVKKRIKTLAEDDRRTLTLTVNRMLTGSTVPEWDTMIFLKETKSPQEYDQAIFRLQSPYTRTQYASSTNEDGSLSFIRRNLKPQTLLIDFNPSRMFQMQELKGRIYIENLGMKGKRELAKRIKEELAVSPIIFANGDKLKRADEIDVVNEVRAYSGTRSISEEVLEMDVDLDVLDDSKRLSVAVANENMLDAKSGLRFGATDDDTDDFNPLAKRPQKPVEKTKEEKKEEGKDPQKALASQFRSYYRRILFFVFLIDDKVDNLDDVVDAIDPSDERKLRIATHLRLNKYDIADLKKMRSAVLHQFEYGISRISELAHDENKKDPVERALVAIRKFGRLGESEIITPQHIARDMVDMIPTSEWKRMISGGEKILDLAAKTGEFAVAIVRKLREAGVREKDYKKSLLAIPTSPISYEFTRKVYELLGLDVKCIAEPENMTSYKLLEIKKHDGKTLDHERIRILLTQKKDLNKISIGDKVAGKATTMCKKVGLVISNPPYQAKGASGGTNDAPIYQDYSLIGARVTGRYSSFIIKAAWTSTGRDSLVGPFRRDMTSCRELRRMTNYVQANDVFPDTEIKGGVCYYFRDDAYNGDCDYTLIQDKKILDERMRDLSEFDILIRDPRTAEIVKKVLRKAKEGGCDFVSSLISADTPFGIPTNPGDSKKTPFVVSDAKTNDFDTILFYLKSRNRCTAYVRSADIVKTGWLIDWRK